MTKTIELTPKSTKWIFIINGMTNSGLGLLQLMTTESWTSWNSLLGLLLVVTGALLLVYGVISFVRTNPLLPKIQVDEGGILIKEDILRVQRKFDWTNIKEITYRSFELNFVLNDNNTETVKLATNAEISVEVKRTIREFADGRQIKIVGG